MLPQIIWGWVFNQSKIGMLEVSEGAYQHDRGNGCRWRQLGAPAVRQGKHNGHRKIRAQPQNGSADKQEAPAHLLHPRHSPINA